MKDKRNPKIKQAAILGVVPIVMFGFAFGLVPLYEVFCELTGFGGGRFEQTAMVSDAPNVPIIAITATNSIRLYPWSSVETLFKFLIGLII